ncbi:TerB family tellurite resistance protein [Myxococcus sp. CA051A]|uniref:Molecular chaperone DjiA n=1 Tax=Myxococcus llanfairpwllgwyngyllgogerychwyrndrobwllllantysiliogogogochensis TaxID=2590453 RepID=A0A540WK72_9BACT|nr:MULTISPECIES: TerB family tellurite resistance protein [Myxococcus]NTX03601.1 TerB family tellurite resistance protein [Myxococcus sp. CA040A]NTX14235.1 TerB family tellurite resistance protein [Myxococcus sp. CA056]NTX35368.1 TerB family tellurite resistance protein [Myxococcus sp. CA033]NTX52011.1 TerB family tellurite resistance protein [Myxococcus sp. CA039A]NTX62217.1 TerB family tellurite resistance protein [Myxococcus sp. CA051A]
MGSGKVLGVMIGLCVGLLIGSPWAIVLLGAVGGFVGHRFDEMNALPAESPDALADFPPVVPSAFAGRGGPRDAASVQEEADAHLTRSLCALFVEVARADGEVRREEVREIRRYFEEVLKYGPDSLEFVRGRLKDFISVPPDLDDAVAACQEALPSSERRRLLDALFELSLVDGSLQRSEREVLSRVGDGLKLSAEEQHAIAALHLGDSSAHYEVLGLTPDATDSEVKSAFRRLAAELHPDKHAHLKGEDAEEVARHFQEVRDAYEEIRRLRGM